MQVWRDHPVKAAVMLRFPPWEIRPSSLAMMRFGSALVSLLCVYSCRRQARRGQGVGGGKKRRRGCLLGFFYGSPIGELGGGQLLPSAPRGYWLRAGGHTLGSRFSSPAKPTVLSSPLTSLHTEGRPISSRSERRSPVASTFCLLNSGTTLK